MTQCKAQSFIPHADKVFVTELESGMRKTRTGIIINDDVGKDHGLRPRWGQVWKVGKNVTDVVPGEWLLLEHGRWSIGIDLLEEDGSTVRIWHIDAEAVLVVNDTDPRLEAVKIGKL